MKFSLKQENFSRALGSVGRVAKPISGMPILKNVLLKTENNQLVVAGTDLNVAITEKVSAKIEKDGAIAAPARLLADYINNLPRGTVEIAVDDMQIKIKSAGFESIINGASAEDFPAIPDIKAAAKISLKADLIKSAIAETAGITSSDPTRPILTGVYIYTRENELFFVATDGYRLAEKSLGKCEADFTAIVPASALSDVSRLIDANFDGEIIVELDDEQISFLIGEIILTSRLIEGKFIDYRQLIPNQTKISATADITEFTRAIKIAEIFARDAAGSITLTVNEKVQTITINSLVSEAGKNSSTIAAEICGDGSITLNSRYILNALSSISGEKIHLNFGEKLAPILLTGESSDYKHIIMPVKS